MKTRSMLKKRRSDDQARYFFPRRSCSLMFTPPSGLNPQRHPRRIARETI
jgi:hypothetical protein